MAAKETFVVLEVVAFLGGGVVDRARNCRCCRECLVLVSAFYYHQGSEHSSTMRTLLFYITNTFIFLCSKMWSVIFISISCIIDVISLIMLGSWNDNTVVVDS